MIAQNDQVISIQRGQSVLFSDGPISTRATIEQIRQIRTAEYLDTYTGSDKDVILTLQMSDSVVTARPWQVILPTI